MFKLLSDLSTVQRKEIPLSSLTANVYVSGYSGSWVTLDGSGYATLTSAETGLAWLVWNESNRNGTQGWSPDVKNAMSVSVFFGKVRGYTDQYSGSPTLGSVMYTTTGGKITPGVIGTNQVVAVCRKAPFSYVQFGTTFTVIEIETV